MNLHEQTNRIKQMMGLLTEQAETPVCDENGCVGKYVGPEFDTNGDIAHKYSNTITKYVSDKLKELYKSGIYVKVDFGGIKIKTKGMGSGSVVYTVNIPFVGVTNKCEATTGFAHVGGWGHTPELNSRKSEILNYIPQGKTDNVVLDNKLYVSQLTKTPEGLEEYWIQWKHKDYQSECGGKTKKTYTIEAPTLKELWEKSKSSEYQNISIDEKSFIVDIDNKTIEFKGGNTPIKSMSFIFDNQGMLENRIEKIQTQNNTMRVIKENLNGPIQWAILIF